MKTQIDNKNESTGILERKKACSNDVYDPEFESKLDSYFSAKKKVKDHATRSASIKLWSQWT